MAQHPEAVPEPQSLDLDFKVPGRTLSNVKVVVRPNDNPSRIGQHLCFPDWNPSDFLGYPVCSARVTSPDSQGYAACYGWVQMVKEAPTSSAFKDAAWEMDPLPITADFNTPFVYFGPEPQLFDTPSRSKDVRELDWSAISFLTYLEDAVMSRTVRPVIAFEWGCWIRDGHVSVKPLKEVSVREAWEEQRALLEGRFAGWKFREFDEAVDKVSKDHL